MASVGELRPDVALAESAERKLVLNSLMKVSSWLVDHDYKGYDTFDGLSSPLLRPLTFESAALRTVLQQGIRRFPLNVRPMVGIKPAHSTKGMGFIARGFMRLHRATGDPIWAERARYALDWLIDHQSTGYSGACWGNHFDYQSRAFYLPKGVPTIVWTSLIGHAFVDGYLHFNDAKYLEIAESACRHIVEDIAAIPDGNTCCLAYVPGKTSCVHNANTLGASLLSRVFSMTGAEAYRDLAFRSLSYTAKYIQADGAWYYGEKENLHWVDNFHTAYVLDCFKIYEQSTGDKHFAPVIALGYDFWKSNFFLEDGTPKYYRQKTLPIDIQCASQAIDTLVLYRDHDRKALDLANKVARWTSANLQDQTGYFYYRRYSGNVINKTPTLHWGQATMVSALAALYEALG